MLETRAERKTVAFGPFELLARIGRGACTTVYKAKHVPTGKLAAIKVLSQLANLDAAALERFKREFTVIRDIQHRHLVKALAIGEERGMHYLVVEYVPGQTLETRIKQHGAMKLEDAALVFVQIADGLRCLHMNSILHRDIKPGNIFLTRENIAKLGDFGLLKQLTEESVITQSHQALGTIEYGAPEQFEDAKRVDNRCDIFSLAATMYTALTGKFPFGNAGQMLTLHRKLLCQFVPLKVLMPDLDPAIDQLMNRCLDADPRRRPSDCEEFLEVLGQLFPAPPDLTDSVIRRAAAKPEPERRATIRYNVDLSATFVPFHENSRKRWGAAILDISATGMRLQTTCPMTVDSVVHVTLGKRAVTELALVRWVQPGENDMCIVGCAFVRPLSPKILEEVVAGEIG